MPTYKPLRSMLLLSTAPETATSVMRAEELGKA